MLKHHITHTGAGHGGGGFEMTLKECRICTLEEVPMRPTCH